MDIKVLDTTFNVIAILDKIESILWIDRYNKVGSVELYTMVDMDILNTVKEDYYLQISESKKTMRVQSIQIKTDFENGDRLIIRGQSIECILGQRIVRDITDINTTYNTDTGIAKLVNDAFVTSSETYRRITGFTVLASGDASITGLPFTGMFYGENILGIVSKWCQESSIGFELLLSSSNTLQFKLYSGKDRSYSQSTNSIVVFSPKFDNLKNADYLRSIEDFKNVCYASFYILAGPVNALVPYLFMSGYTQYAPFETQIIGLNRKETWVDCRDLPLYEEEGTTPVNVQAYMRQVKLRTIIEQYNKRVIEEFEGQGEVENTYLYNRDYGLGDIVQIEDRYGHSGRARITEVVISDSPSGKFIYPTFEPV